jgi:hypothetical protein
LPRHDTSAAEELQELLEWVRTKSRKPLQILHPKTPEQHEEKRLGKAFCKLRTKAKTGLLPDGIASELDKVCMGEIESGRVLSFPGVHLKHHLLAS